MRSEALNVPSKFYLKLFSNRNASLPERSVMGLCVACYQIGTNTLLLLSFDLRFGLSTFGRDTYQDIEKMALHLLVLFALVHYLVR